MPFDYYDHFLKQKNNRIFTDITNIVRQKFWRESYDVDESQKWEDITEKTRKNQIFSDEYCLKKKKY